MTGRTRDDGRDARYLLAEEGRPSNKRGTAAVGAPTRQRVIVLTFDTADEARAWDAAGQPLALYPGGVYPEQSYGRDQGKRRVIHNENHSKSPDLSPSNGAGEGVRHRVGIGVHPRGARNSPRSARAARETTSGADDAQAPPEHRAPPTGRES